MAESQVQLQADNITQVPGGGIRMVQAFINIQGVMTPVLMQVVSMSDATGAVVEDWGQLFASGSTRSG